MTEKTASTSGAHWKDEELLPLIKIWSEEEIFRETENTRKKRKPVYGLIQRRLAALGIHRDESQIKSKLRAVKREYKAVLKHNNTSGNNRKTMNFFDELNELLGHKPAFNPPKWLDSRDRE